MALCEDCKKAICTAPNGVGIRIDICKDCTIEDVSNFWGSDSIDTRQEAEKSMSEWIEYPKNKPNQNSEVLILLKNGSIYRAKYMVIILVQHDPYKGYLGGYKIVNNSDPVEIFIPHTHELTPDFKELAKETVYFMNLSNLPLLEKCHE